MRTRSKLLLGALAAATMLALAVGTASANRLSVTEQNFEIIFRAPELLVFNAAGNTIRCNVTLLGSFVERTIRKETANEIGHIFHVEIANCTRPTVVLGATLPWEVGYVSFSGTLPNGITGIRLKLIEVAFLVEVAGESCLAGTTAAEPAFGEASLSGGRVTNLRADENARIRLGGGFLCRLAGTSTFRGEADVTNLPRTAALTVTLI